MDTCDVLIVGGGPAGSTCARRLVDAGLDVALLDRATFPRDKVCAGWITPAAVRALDLDLRAYASTRTLQAFTGFRTATLRGRPHHTHFGTTISYGIRRCEFDDYLLTRSGVRQLPAHGVQTLQHDHNGWIVNGTIRTRLLVGAGGHFCPVAREVNRGLPDFPVVAARETEFELDTAQAASCAIAGATPELFFWPDLLGYAWCVRKGSFLNIGAGRLAPSPLPLAMPEFIARLRGRGLLPASPVKWKGHAYLLSRTSARRLVADHAVLIGDAAGLALAPSGEGILSAIESGLLAAEAIVEARHEYTATTLAPYAARAEARFGPRATAAPRALPRWLAATAAIAVLNVPWLTRRVLLEEGFLHTRRPDIATAVDRSGSGATLEQFAGLQS